MLIQPISWLFHQWERSCVMLIQPVHHCFTSGNGHVSCWFNLSHHCFTSGNGHVSCWFNLFHHCFTSRNGHVSCWFNVFHHCFTSVNGHVSCWFKLFHDYFTNVDGRVSCWFILFRHCFIAVSPVGTSLQPAAGWRRPYPFEDFCSLCHGHEAIQKFDDLVRTGLRNITNLFISDIQWVQAILPVSIGGLGVRRVASLELPAFLALAAATDTLQSLLLYNSHHSPDLHRDNLLSTTFKRTRRFIWRQTKRWDKPAIAADQAAVKSHFCDSFNTTRLLAVSAPHSGNWLHALPLATCSLKLDNEAIRLAVGLRLVINLCEPHQCSALVENWLTLAALTGYPANTAQPEQFDITSSMITSAAPW